MDPKASLLQSRATSQHSKQVISPGTSHVHDVTFSDILFSITYLDFGRHVECMTPLSAAVKSLIRPAQAAAACSARRISRQGTILAATGHPCKLKESFAPMVEESRLALLSTASFSGLRSNAPSKCSTSNPCSQHSTPKRQPRRSYPGPGWNYWQGIQDEY